MAKDEDEIYLERSYWRPFGTLLQRLISLFAAVMYVMICVATSTPKRFVVCQLLLMRPMMIKVQALRAVNHLQFLKKMTKGQTRQTKDKQKDSGQRRQRAE